MKKFLLVALLSGLSLSGSPARAEDDVSRNWVRFQTWGEDSLAIYASYYPAAVSELPVVLMLHDRGGEGSDFGALATRFVRGGIPVFLPDLRGEGQSTGSRRGSVGPAERWGAAEWPLLLKDLDGIFAFAEAQESLSDRGWVIVADGEAAGIALALAKSDPRLRGIILLSPLGFDRPESLAKIEIPVLLLACEADADAAEKVRELYDDLAPEFRRMDVMPCNSRGHRMLRWVGGLPERLTDWTRRIDAKTP